jgi:hypothetical protein
MFFRRHCLYLEKNAINAPAKNYVNRTIKVSKIDLVALDGHRHGVSAAQTERGDAFFLAAAAQFMQKRG